MNKTFPQPTPAYLESTSLSICCFNARSIVNKLNTYAFLTCNIDLIFVTETWLSTNFLDSMICYRDYNVIKDDRRYSKGGGVMLLYKNHLSVSRYIPLLSAENKLFEFISVDVFANKNCLRFTCFYIPPSTVGSYNDFYYACKCLSDCHTTCSPHFVCGDFNLPNIDWSILVSVGNSAHDYFVELCNNLNHVQHICVPTQLLYDVQLLYDAIIDKVNLSIGHHVPPKPIHSKPAIPYNVRQLLKEKKRLCSVNKAAYNEVSKNYDQAVKLWCDKIENAICENPNSAKFYGFAKNKLKSHACIPPLKSDDDTLAETDVEKANLLNLTFQKVFRIDDGQSLSLNCSVVPENWIRDIDIFSEDIIQAIHLIPDKLSTSPDGIPAFFWKRVFFSILNLLWLLFSLCLSQGTLPIQWKSVIVIPIHKKGSRDHPGNYRPISLTCVLCRVLEHIIANKLLHHFYCNNLLSVNQFGFLPGRSSCSQLLTVLNKWFSKYDNNDQVDVVYTDIAKAFDSVSHSKLISVLNSFGVSGNLLKWINAFLCNRNQKVCVNNSFSSTLEVYSGVPQGSVLGPLLFVVCIDDLVNAASLTRTTANGIYLFADDAKLFSDVPHKLQTALDSINAWVNDRQLSLAPSVA